MPYFPDWDHYAADAASSKYSGLKQISRQNFARLKQAWSWEAPEREMAGRDPRFRAAHYESTPIFVQNRLFVSTSFSQVASLDPATGKAKWVYNPPLDPASARFEWVHRGVAAATVGRKLRIYVGTVDGNLVALDAVTGKPVSSFGSKGRVDLRLARSVPGTNIPMFSVSSPPMIVGQTVVIGCRIEDYPYRGRPSGETLAFDLATGKLKWSFSASPDAMSNAWAPMSADLKRGLVYLPTGSAANDFYGAARPGNNGDANSIVCLRADTGEKVLSRQLVHHDLWDYDLPCAPMLADVGGRPLVVQLTKQGFAFVFDRVTGKPVWPIEERPVPTSTMPGEVASPTQPFPNRPVAFEMQGFGSKVAGEAQKYLVGPMFTPIAPGQTLLMLPGTLGGASWAGGGFDPANSWLFVPSITAPTKVEAVIPDPKVSDAPHAGRVLGALNFVTPPPYGRITAFDLSTGDMKWATAIGGRDGLPARTHVLVTPDFLLAAQESFYAGPARNLDGSPSSEPPVERPSLRAIDKRTGRISAKLPLPGSPGGAPMTYAYRGKQYIVLPVGGFREPARLVAFALKPKP